jgi:hypothetical protein
VRTFLEQNSYLLGGQSTLQAFRTRLIELVQKPRPLGDPDRAELRRLLAARNAIIGTGSSERARIVSFWSGVVIVIGALTATLGSATFALATNHDLILREDKLAKEERARKSITAGELMPKTPSPVLVVVPEKAASRKAVQKLLGSKCQLAGVKAILIDIREAPAAETTFGTEPAIFHVITERTPKCAVTHFWVPTSWVVPRPVEAMSPTATPAAGGTSGTGTQTTGAAGQ